MAVLARNAKPNARASINKHDESDVGRARNEKEPARLAKVVRFVSRGWEQHKRTAASAPS